MIRCALCGLRDGEQIFVRCYLVFVEERQSSSSNRLRIDLTPYALSHVLSRIQRAMREEKNMLGIFYGVEQLHIDSQVIHHFG